MAQTPPPHNSDAPIPLRGFASAYEPGVWHSPGIADKTVQIWDATTGAEVTKMEGHSHSVRSVAFSPDGAHVVSDSSDKTVWIWDATTGAEVMKMEGHYIRPLFLQIR